MKNEFSFFTRPLINYQRLSQRLCGPTHFQERLGVLAATCAARERLPLRTSAIRWRRFYHLPEFIS